MTNRRLVTRQDRSGCSAWWRDMRAAGTASFIFPRLEEI